MSKRKTNKRGLGVFLVLVAVAGVGTATAAILTKGFTSFGAIKGEKVVSTFKADRLQDGTLRLINDDDVKITASFEGSLSDANVLTLGDKEDDAAVSKSDLQTSLLGYGVSNSDVEKIEGDVVALNVAKYSKLSLDLSVEYKKESATTGAAEFAYFDAVKINYKVPGSRGILTTNKNDSKKDYDYHKRINNVTNLSETIELFALENEETQSVNSIDMLTFSLEAAKDNTIEIKSIEFIKKAKGHANDLCWVTQ